MLSQKNGTMREAGDTHPERESEGERIAALEREMFLHDQAELRAEGFADGFKKAFRKSLIIKDLKMNCLIVEGELKEIRPKNVEMWKERVETGRKEGKEEEEEEIEEDCLKEILYKDIRRLSRYKVPAAKIAELLDCSEKEIQWILAMPRADLEKL